MGAQLFISAAAEPSARPLPRARRPVPSS